MVLTLEVIDPEARRSPRRLQLRAEGGTIGRNPTSTLLLDDVHVSGQHAVIHYTGGVFSIEDRSRNGVFLDSPQNKLTKGERVPLRTGNVVLIDPYEILVTIEGAQVASHLPAPPPSADWRDFDQGLVTEGIQPIVSTAPVEDLLEGIGLPGSSDVPPGAPLIPPDWLREHMDPPAVPITPHPASKTPVPAPPPSSLDYDEPRGDVLAAVLAGAGIDPKHVTPELAENLGRILRVVVAGTMDVLAARQQTKEELRMGLTTFRPRGNNPLKFSTSVEDALHNLLVKRGDGYLGPVEAFEDAFDDLRHHQVATWEGVRRAFGSMLDLFDPKRLQEEFDKGQKSALVSMPAQLRYWSQYRDWFRDMVADVDGSFRELFGDAFADAYEEQVKKLKARGRSGASHRDDKGR